MNTTNQKGYLFMSKFQVIEHPLIQHKLTIMRQKDTPTSEFKQLLDEIS